MRPETALSLLPLTPNQYEIWLDQKLHPGDALYNVVGYAKIDGRVDAALFEAAVNAVIAHHDTVRLCLIEDRDQVFQRIEPEWAYDVDVVDFSAQPDGDADSMAYLHRESRRPFRLDQFPLFQIDLIRAHQDRTYWLFKFHHLIADGYATWLIGDHIRLAYNTLLAGKPVNLPEAVSYAEYAEDEQGYLHSAHYIRDKAYWTRKFQILPEPLFVQNVSGCDDHSGNTRDRLELRGPLYEELMVISDRMGRSVFQVLAGLFYVYFSHYSGSQEWVMGLPVLNRRQAKYKKMGGLCAGVTPFLCNFGLDKTFSELLGQISDELRRDYRHQRYSIGDLRRALQREDHAGMATLMVSYMENRFSGNVDDFPTSVHTLYQGGDEEGLVIRIDDYGQLGYMVMNFDYHHMTLNASEIQQMKDGLVQLIETLSQHPELVLRQACASPRKASFVYPLTAGQKGIWVREELGLWGAAYHIGVGYELRGSLDEPMMFAFIRHLLTLHEALRSKIVEIEGELGQVVVPVDRVLPRLYHYEGLGVGATLHTKEDIDFYVAQEITQPFHLKEGYVFRVRIKALAPDRHVMIVAMHHIVSDGWSVTVILDALKNWCAGSRVESTAAPLSYREFAWQEQQSLSQGLFSSAKSYWTHKLLPDGELPQLPGRKAVIESWRANESGRVYVAFNEEETSMLLALGIRENASLFMVLMSGVKILLRRYSGQNHIPVGTIISRRDDDALTHEVGYYANTLVISDDIRMTDRVSDVICLVRQSLLEGYGHGRYPFECVIDDLGLNGAQIGETDLFNVMAVMQTMRKVEIALPGLQVQKIDTGGVGSKYDLNIEFDEEGGALTALLEYRRDRYEAGAIERMGRHLKAVLKDMALSSDKAVRDIELMGAIERKLIVKGFSEGPSELAGSETVMSCFDDQVRQTPDAVALYYGNADKVTYSALYSQAECVARYLIRDHHVGSESVVGLFMGRGPALFAGLFGVMKAGGAYMPIDTGYPIDRKVYMVTNSRCRVLLVDTALSAHDYDRLSAHATVIHIDDILKRPESESERALSLPIRKGEDLAYVIYTSGSTGSPKGVMIEDRQLAHYLNWACDTYFKSQDKGDMALFTSIGFDLTVTSLYLPILRGGAVTIFSEDEEISDVLIRILNSETIEAVKLTPSHIEMIKALGLKRSAVKVAIVGGEALKEAQVSILKGLNPEMVVYNEYGPTETTVGCSVCDLSAGEPIHIGRPIANTCIFILDDVGLPVSAGVEGELWIGGDGVGRGYVEMPDETAKKFIDNPFGSGRLYRSGDRGLWQEDGTIRYLGRRDDQIKIRGYRIEIGEIESAIRRCPGVNHCKVIIEPGPTDPLIAAYLLLETASDFEVQIDRIQDSLKFELPSYMLPQHVAVVSEIPLTANGKVNASKLASHILYKGWEVPVSSMALPQDDIETQILEVWQSVFKIDAIGVNDHYLNLGGDSIKAIQIVSRLRHIGLVCQVRDVFEAKTIRTLRHMVKEGTWAISQEPVSGDMPLTPIQSRFFVESDHHVHHYHQAILLENVGSPIEAATLDAALRFFQRHHDALRIRFDLSRVPVAQINLDIGCEEALEQCMIESDSVSDLQAAMEAAHRSIHLENGPIMKAILFRGPTKEWLFMTIHHSVIDAVSWRILLEDLQAAYQQAAEGKTLHLVRKTHSYRDWAMALSGYDVADEAAYWKTVTRKVKGGSALSALTKTGDLCLKGLMYSDLAQKTMSLSRSQTEQLTRGIHHAYHTQINDILLTGLCRTIAQLTEVSSVSLELEGHGREEVLDGMDITRTIGWFTTLFPFVVELDQRNTMGDDIVALKRALEGIPNKGIGFGILQQRTLLSDGDDYDVVPEMLFNYLGEFDQVQLAMKSSEGLNLRVTDQSAGVTIDPMRPLSHALYFNSSIANKQLDIILSYPKPLFSDELIDTLLTGYVSKLHDIVAHCREVLSVWPGQFTHPTLRREDLRIGLSYFKLKPAQVEDVYELTPLQQGMLFQGLYDPDSTAYFEEMSFEIEGTLDPAVFQKSWEDVMNRHQALRAMFVYEMVPAPLQVILADRKPEFYFEDLRSEDHECQEARIADYRLDERARRFDLATDSLIRLRLIARSDRTYRVLVYHHHIIMDGWSLVIVLKDLLTFYEAHLYHKAADLLPAPAFSDYTGWLGRQDSESGRRYWQSYLEGYEKKHGLLAPLTKIDALHDLKLWKTSDILFDASATSALTTGARQSDVTMSLLLQAAWALTVGMYNSTRDVVLGVTVSGRPPDIIGIETMVGLFINTIPVRLTWEPDETVAGFLGKLRSAEADRRLYEHISLADIQAQLKTGNELIDHLFVYENYPVDESVSGLDDHLGFQIKNVRVDEETGYDLGVMILPGEHLRFGIKYNAHRYSPFVIEAALASFRHIVTQLSAQPSRALSQITLLTLDQRQAVLALGAADKKTYELESIVTMFDRQVTKTPEAIAVIDEVQRLTYAELYSQVMNVAHHLQHAHIKAGDKVAICMPRQCGLLAAILGILWVGCTYVPIDLATPEDRIVTMLEAVGVTVVIGLALHAAPFSAFRFLAFEKMLSDAYGEIIKPVPQSLSRLLYVIFTSGSTGVPKAVGIREESFQNTLSWYRDCLDLSSEDRLLCLISIAFDAAQKNLLAPLMTGASAVMIPEYDPDLVCEMTIREKVTIFNCTPGALQPVITCDETAFDTVRAILIGGEAWQLSGLSAFLSSRLDRMKLFNVYGPTECSDIVTCYEVTASDLISDMIPIGKPVPNMDIMILDEALRLVAAGAEGEICVAGPGVSERYLNQEQLHGSPFIQDPYHPGRHLYRTGDRGRFDFEGNVIFLGRQDDQVKIRGYRIELGEIVTAALHYPGVSDAIVLAKPMGAESDKALVLYVLSDDVAISESAIREYLSARLPQYMIPSYVMIMAAWPLTSRGKVDRRSLPDPQPTTLRKTDYVAPDTQTQGVLVTIWESVLSVQSIGIDDNFFELGGHSLLAIQLVSQIRRRFSHAVSVATIFEYPTIRKLADFFEKKDTSPPAS